MKFAWLVIAVFAARFFATAIVYPAGDGDLSWQRWLGSVIARTHAIPHALGAETFSAAGAPWIPQEWAFSLAADAARNGAAYAFFAGLVAFCAVAALALAAWHAERRGASPRAIALCTALAGVALYESFGVRAQVTAWPLVALFLLVLDVDGPWAFAAIGVAALWSNLHASAMLAPVLALLAAAGSACEARGFDARTRRFALIAAGSLVAICANPFGWHLPAYAIGLFASPIKAYITEWKITDLDDSSFAYGSLPLLLIAAGVFAGVRARRYRELFVLAAFAVLLLGAARNVALFGIVALPIVAPALSRAFAWFAPEARSEPSAADRRAAFALPVAALVMAAVVAVQLVRNAPPETGLASKPLHALANEPGEHALFCADFAWCGLAVGMPHVRVFLDGRADPYPEAVWSDFVRIARVGSAWERTLERRGVDTVLVGRDAPLDQALAASHAWRVRYADATYRLWTRARVRVAFSA